MSIIKTNEHLPFVQKKRNDHIFLFSRKTKFLKNKNKKEIRLIFRRSNFLFFSSSIKPRFQTIITHLFYLTFLCSVRARYVKVRFNLEVFGFQIVQKLTQRSNLILGFWVCKSFKDLS